MFTGWNEKKSKVNVWINGHELERHAVIKKEKKGRTICEKHIPHEWLRLHGQGANRLTVVFVEGHSHVFLDWFKISADIPEGVHLGVGGV